MIYSLVAVIHECGHAFYAYKIGFKLNRVVLMPYGAVVNGNIDGITFLDEVKLLLCGPLCNFIICIIFVCCWWFFPLSYPYTDTAVYSSFSIGVLNLLPFYPLDGGKIVYRVMSEKINEKFAFRFALILSISFALLLIIVFIIGEKSINSFTLLSFAFLLVVGVFSAGKNKYTKIDFYIVDSIKRGLEVRTVAVDINVTLKKLISYLQSDKFYKFDVYKNEEYLLTITQNQLMLYFERESIYESLSTILKKENIGDL